MPLSRPAALLTAALLLAALQACGQAGDLYLPQEPPKAPPAPVQPVVVTPADTPAPAAGPVESEPKEESEPRD